MSAASIGLTVEIIIRRGGTIVMSHIGQAHNELMWRAGHDWQIPLDNSSKLGLLAFKFTPTMIEVKSNGELVWAGVKP